MLPALAFQSFELAPGSVPLSTDFYMNDSVMLGMSLSASLYYSYARLFERFSTSLFSFDAMVETLSASKQGALKHASLLRRRGYLVVFGRQGRARQYRLLSPEQAMFAHLHMRGLGALVQSRYTHLIVDACMQLRRDESLGLSGVWLFGSVARGEAREDSDVDLVIVAKNLHGNRSQMNDRVYEAIDIARERQFLYEHGIITDLSVFATEGQELDRFYPLFLDALQEGVVIYDETGALTQAVEAMRARASELGLKRVELSKGWMWTLPPGLEVGKPFEI